MKKYNFTNKQKDQTKFILACKSTVLVYTMGRHLHTHLSIVDQVLQWVAAGEPVHNLLVIGDGSFAGILRANHAWDGDILNAGEICKLPISWLLSDLWGKDVLWKNLLC